MQAPRPESEPRPIRWSGSLGALVALAMAATAVPARGEDPAWREARRGRELFLRDWRVDDSRSHGGDGLGPVYNATSCVACHGLGGPGGAGSKETNVNLLSLAKFDQVSFPPPGSDARPGPQAGRRGPPPRPANLTWNRDTVIERLLPGLRESPGVVLHHFGTDPLYGTRRDALLTLGLSNGQSQGVPKASSETDAAASSGLVPADAAMMSHLRNSRLASVTQRNPTPLFGLGLIDAIPDAAIADAARESMARSPGAHGRPHALKGRLVGKFGWKAQVPSIQEFVLTACANELGLENPGHRQAPSPFAADTLARKPDLTGAECDALVAYVRDLPTPTVLDLGPIGSTAAKEGRRLFDSTGCADCHRPRLGDVDGIYSDLLLHDMGRGLSDSGQYYGSDGSGSSDAPSPSEWRTPPLWGLRESAPYLHDGRAADVAKAVSYHGGGARESARRYAALSPEERLRLDTFLMSLTAPASPRELARRGELARAEWAAGVAEAESAARDRERRRVEEQERLREEVAKRQAAEEARRIDGMLQIARMTERNGHIKAALDLYREIAERHRSTPAAKEAQARLDDLTRR